MRGVATATGTSFSPSFAGNAKALARDRDEGSVVPPEFTRVTRVSIPRSDRSFTGVLFDNGEPPARPTRRAVGGGPACPLRPPLRRTRSAAVGLARTGGAGSPLALCLGAP